MPTKKVRQNSDLHAVFTYLITLTLFIILVWWLERTGMYVPMLSQVERLSETLKIFIRALEQEVLLIGMMLIVMTKIFFKHWTVADVKEYFKKRMKRKGRYAFHHYVLGWFILYYVCNIFLFTILQQFNLTIPWLYGDQTTIALVANIAIHHRREYFVLFVLVSLLAPAVEEVVYRWFITDVLMKHYKWRWVVWAAAIFALSHIQRWVILNLFFLSCIIGYIYYKTQSMIYSFLFHFMINSLTLGVIFLMKFYPHLAG